MKTLDDLKQIQIESANRMSMKDIQNGYRIVVGMATCGITAGAKPIYDALNEGVKKLGFENVTVVPVGCMGECALEPIVEVYSHEGRRSTYCKVKESDVERILYKHIINNEIVEDLLITKHKR